MDSTVVTVIPVETVGRIAAPANDMTAMPASAPTSRQRTTYDLTGIGKITRTTEESPKRNGNNPEADKPVDLESLLMAWTEFTEKRKGQLAEYQLLKREIVLQDNQVIISLNNAVEEPLLQGIRSSLVNYLREKLNNSALSVRGELRESPSKKIAYTAKEKLEYLATKNPLLHELKERFGLDTDF